MFKYQMGGNEEPGSSQVVLKDRTSGNGFKSKHRKFNLHVRKDFLIVTALNTQAGCPERLWSLRPWGYMQNLPGRGTRV